MIDPVAPDTLRAAAERIARHRDQLDQRRELTRSDLRWLAMVGEAAVLTLLQQAEEGKEDDDRDSNPSTEALCLSGKTL